MRIGEYRNAFETTEGNMDAFSFYARTTNPPTCDVELQESRRFDEALMILKDPRVEIAEGMPAKERAEHERLEEFKKKKFMENLSGVVPADWADTWWRTSRDAENIKTAWQRQPPRRLELASDDTPEKGGEEAAGAENEADDRLSAIRAARAARRRAKRAGEPPAPPMQETARGDEKSANLDEIRRKRQGLRRCRHE